MAEPALLLEAEPRLAALSDQLAVCVTELREARREVDRHAAACARRGLPVDGAVATSLLGAARQAELRVLRQQRRTFVHPADDLPAALSAGEVVVRFALSTVAYVRGALEWCAQSYGQSRAVQFFDPGALDCPSVNYERYEHRAVERVERQLMEVFGLSADTHGLSVTSSGMAAFSVIESFLVRTRLRPGDTVLLAPYIYFESAEQLEALPFITVERACGYGVGEIVADVERLRPRCLFVDPVANIGTQRMIDLAALFERLREVLTEPLTVVVDGTMIAAALPADLLESDDRLEILYYESGSKYLQLGMDSGMAGMLVYPSELSERMSLLRRNAGAVLYRHSAELFPRYDRAALRERMGRVCANAERLAATLGADPRVLAAGSVHHPALPEHPDHGIAATLDYASGFATFLFHANARNTRDRLSPVIDAIIEHAGAAAVQLTKGASFGFSAPRASPADPMAEGEPTFLRLYAGDRAEQIPALAEAVARALAANPG
ncbi:PLP-dependent transferase [Actinokineospora sp. 24-640]